MKYLLLIFTAVFGLTFVACSDDDAEATIDADLYLDGINNTAPFFDPGTYQCAARFKQADLSDFQGKNLISVEYFILNMPTKCTIKIFDGSSPLQPGNLLYSRDVTSTTSASSWNLHPVEESLTIGSSDLWLCVEVEHATRTNSIGCDFGPAQADGDWIHTVTDTVWETYRERTENVVSINWNIRGHVEE